MTTTFIKLSKEAFVAEYKNIIFLAVMNRGVGNGSIFLFNND